MNERTPKPRQVDKIERRTTAKVVPPEARLLRLPPRHKEAIKRRIYVGLETLIAALFVTPLALVVILSILPDLRYALLNNKKLVSAINFFVFDDPGPPPPPNVMWLERLKILDVAFAELPNRPKNKTGCGYDGAVRLSRIGKVEVMNGALVTWPLAVQLEEWVRTEIQPNAKQLFGQEVVRMRATSSYECRFTRPRVLSQHGYANAVDITGFWLADGRRIRVVDDWKANGAFAEFLHRLGQASCRIFSVALTPDHDFQHRHHFHFDAGRRQFCGYNDKKHRRLLVSSEAAGARGTALASRQELAKAGR